VKRIGIHAIFGYIFTNLPYFAVSMFTIDEFVSFFSLLCLVPNARESLNQVT
jgi:hypothetical protein